MNSFLLPATTTRLATYCLNFLLLPFVVHVGKLLPFAFVLHLEYFLRLFLGPLLLTDPNNVWSGILQLLLRGKYNKTWKVGH